jgi:hypothetical protein
LMKKALFHKSTIKISMIVLIHFRVTFLVVVFFLNDIRIPFKNAHPSHPLANNWHSVIQYFKAK